MTKKSKKGNPSFWTTLPGILTGCATFIAAIGSCLGIIVAWPRPNIIFPPTPVTVNTLGTTSFGQQTAVTQSLSTPALSRSTPVSKGQILYGPAIGKLEHDKDGSISGSSANLNVRDFVAQVSFQNPYDISQGIWDYGFFLENGRDG